MSIVRRLYGCQALAPYLSAGCRAVNGLVPRALSMVEYEIV
jgi:hypothetical protein